MVKRKWKDMTKCDSVNRFVNKLLNYIEEHK